MTTPSTCPLCANVATVEAREGGWRVACPQCLRFTLDPYLIELFHEARQGAETRVLRLLPRLSEAARRAASQGGRLELVAENSQAVASDAAPRLLTPASV
jgi:hypothetical protein